MRQEIRDGIAGYEDGAKNRPGGRVMIRLIGLSTLGAFAVGAYYGAFSWIIVFALGGLNFVGTAPTQIEDRVHFEAKRGNSDITALKPGIGGLLAGAFITSLGIIAAIHGFGCLAHRLF